MSTFDCQRVNLLTRLPSSCRFRDGVLRSRRPGSAFPRSLPALPRVDGSWHLVGYRAEPLAPTVLRTCHTREEAEALLAAWAAHLEGYTRLVVEQARDRGQRRKLSAEAAQEIRRLSREGWSRKQLAERYGVHVGTVGDVLRGVTYRRKR